MRARSGDADLLRIVDKQRGLPATHAPADLVPIDGRWTVPGFAGQSLRTEAASALVAMLSAAEEQGMRLRIRSGFRSYQEQVQTFDFWVALLGEVQARRESAPAGHSEHQLGTAADVVSAEVGWELIIPFADTAGGRWLAEHAPQYGFAFSYPRDGEPITGYIYEPWHVRYIGTDCAAAWRASGLVLVRFLERLASTR